MPGINEEIAENQRNSKTLKIDKYYLYFQF